jgi:hypothetical protein
LKPSASELRLSNDTKVMAYLMSNFNSTNCLVLRLINSSLSMMSMAWISN